MKRYFRVFMCLLFTMGAFCTAAAAENLVIAGTGDSQTLLRNLGLLYEKAHPGTDIIVPDSVGSGGGIKALIKGTTGLARTARPLKPKEQNYSFIEIPFALSPVVLAANPSAAKVANISTDDLIKVYKGEINNWNQLGGNDSKIYPIDREPGDSSRKILENNLNSSSGSFKDIKSRGKVFYSTPETAQAIKQNSNTLGYLPLSIAKEAELHILALESAQPEKIDVLKKNYPLVTTFYLIKPVDPSPLADSFLSFIQEPEAREFMLSSGVIPLEK